MNVESWINDGRDERIDLFRIRSVRLAES